MTTPDRNNQGDNRREIPLGAPSPEFQELLDKHIDSVLTPEESRVFEAFLAATPALREEVQAQHTAQARIDASLKSRFAPDVNGIDPLRVNVDGVERTFKIATPRPRRWGWVSRVAAVVVLGVLGVWTYSLYSNQPAKVLKDPVAVFEKTVSGGMTPYAVCTTDTEFAAYTKQQFGKALLVKPIPGLALIGWNYELDLLGPNTTVLLAKVGEQPVLVYMDLDDHDRRLKAPDQGDLKFFRREVGGVVLWEANRAGKPLVLEQFYLTK